VVEISATGTVASVSVPTRSSQWLDWAAAVAASEIDALLREERLPVPETGLGPALGKL
jgi:hypothetical protein